MTQANSINAQISITPETRLYDRMIFGGFLEHFHRQIYGGIYEPGSPLSDARGFRKDVIEAVRELRTPVVRWPGGCFVSAYHWKDGVGKDRQPSFDKAWGVEDPNTFGTDEFVEWCRLAGTEPYICGNAGTGTPEEMSDWVEYCNQTQGRWARLRAANGYPRPHNVRYWSVGNENWGSWEVGAKTSDEWGPFVCETAKMIRYVDSSVVLLAAALPDKDWTEKLLRHAGNRLDMVSIHGYWDPLWANDVPSDYAACMMRSTEPEKSILATKEIIAAAGFENKIGIAFDEWNLRGWHHPGHGIGFGAEQIQARDRNDINGTYTMADAIFSACFLNTCLRHCDTVNMANLAPLVNARGPLYVHPEGIVKRTTFHVMSMYANLLGPQVAKADVTSDSFSRGEASIAAVDAVATCDADGKNWNIAVVNRHPSATVRCVIQIEEMAASGSCKATVLSGDAVDAYNDVESPDRVIPRQLEMIFEDGGIAVPPHSLVIFEMEKA